MNDSRIAAIRARLERATPGKWQTIPAHDPNERKRGIVYDGEPYGNGRMVCDSAEQKDAEFIAAAPDDIRWLLARLDEIHRLALHGTNVATDLQQIVKLSGGDE